MENTEYLTFDTMGLKMTLLRGIYSYGFETPSIIQQKAIVPFIHNNDMIAQAQSGTGKTGTFCIAALQNINESSPTLQCIILSHTRELAIQTQLILDCFGRYMPGFKSVLAVGKDNIHDTIRALQSGPQIMVGTPGRIYHLINDAYVNPNTIRWVIMDEADQLLSHDFREQIYDIYMALPHHVDNTLKSGLYTATVTNEMEDITRHFMKNPVLILIPPEELSLEGIKQYFVDFRRDDDKFLALVDIYSTVSICQMIIYCNSKPKTETLKRKLGLKDIPADCIHGEMNAQERTAVMKNFRRGGSRVLITTDLLARGIDIQQVSLVINYDFPTNIESYLHRIGRTGRYGKKGLAINFITRQDYQNIESVESYYKIRIDELPENIDEILRTNLK